MEPRTIQGFVFVDAPYSALNNAGKSSSDRTDNIVRTKSLWRSGEMYPYVSGQAWRYWWREALAKHKNWELSPITREKKIAFTEADPIKYLDDDMFGYMRAEKKETLTRISVLKNSPLISVSPHRPKEDFGTFSRHEGDPVPFEHEFYSTVLKGIFTVDLATAGIFFRVKRSGMHNLSENYKVPKDCITKEKEVWLPREKRAKRIKDVIEVIPHLAGGAMQARHLTRVAPSLLVIGAFRTAGQLLSHLAKDDKGKPDFHMEALNEMIKNNEDQFLSKIYIGVEKGFMDHLDKPLTALAKENKNIVYYPSVSKAIKDFSETIDSYIPEPE